ncbi:MAG: hypothetical protein GXY48_00840 [Methanomicrobiales archaeon]|nr:hypothetical protein [Methanomicrobiales archaeon]
MAENDKRFQMGWAGAALMFGVALIINYFSSGDFYLVASIFFIGLGMILGALGYGLGKKNTYLLGFAGLLALIGVISILLRPPPIEIDFGLFFGGLIAGAALAFMVYTYTKK